MGVKRERVYSSSNEWNELDLHEYSKIDAVLAQLQGVCSLGIVALVIITWITKLTLNIWAIIVIVLGVIFLAFIGDAITAWSNYATAKTSETDSDEYDDAP